MAESALTRLARIDRETPAYLMAVGCMLLAIANMLVDTWVPRRLLVLVGLALLVYEALAFRSMKYEQYFLYAVGLWIAMAVTLNGVIFGEWVQESVYLPVNIAVALALCRGHVGPRTTRVIFYALAGYFTFRLLTVSSPGAIHHILTSGSANGISELMLVLCTLHYAMCYQQGRPIRVLPAVVCLLVSAMTLGRSGMAAGALLLAGVGVWDLAAEQSRRRRAAKLVLYGGVGVIAAVFLAPRIDAISFVFERFSQYGLESEGRAQIWGDYAETLRGPAVLLGHGRSDLFSGYSSVHNSYLLWHKSMGVLAVPLYLLTLLALLRALLRDRMLFLLLAPLMFRSFFDESLLPSRLYDFVYFYLVCTILVTLPPWRQPVRMPVPVEA